VAQTSRPVTQAPLVEHRSGLDHFQRVHRLLVAFRVGDPAFRLGRAGHPLHLVDRRLIASLLERPARAFEALLRLRRGRGLAAHHEELFQLALEGPPRGALVALAQLRAEAVEPGDEAVEAHRPAREIDDRADRVGPLVAEAQAQLIGEIAQFRPALDRAAGGEGDQQALRARGVAGGGLGLEIQSGEALLGGGEALVEPALLLGNLGDLLPGRGGSGLGARRGGKGGARRGGNSGDGRARRSGTVGGEVVPHHPADQPPAGDKGKGGGEHYAAPRAGGAAGGGGAIGRWSRL
jgi:hypothetical protein